MTKQERQILEQAATEVAEGREMYSCIAISYCGGGHKTDHDPNTLRKRYAAFFGQDDGCVFWAQNWPQDVPLKEQFAVEKNQRLLGLAMFMELEDKV